MSLLKDYIYCPACKEPVCLPIVWRLGFETIVRCPSCRKQYKTGRKAGAIIFGLSLGLALAVVNVLCYVLPSSFIPYLFILVLPLWVLLGWFFRRNYLIFKSRKQ